MSAPRGTPVRPVVLRALAASTAIALAHSAAPATRYAAAWLPLVHLTALWLVVGPLQSVISRPGGTFSVPSWLNRALAVAPAPAGEDSKGWREAVVQGGCVALMNYAGVRAFVGLDAASAIALLSLGIPISLIDRTNVHIPSTSTLLLSLGATSLSLALATMAPLTTLHNRTYSFLMCAVCLSCALYIRVTTGLDPLASTMRTIREPRTSKVVLASTLGLPLMFAVNEQERLLPDSSTIPLLLLSAVLFVVSTTASLSTLGGSSGPTSSSAELADSAAVTPVGIACSSTATTKLATTGTTLVFTALAQFFSTGSVLRVPEPVLMAQAFIFLAATAGTFSLPPPPPHRPSSGGAASYANLGETSSVAGNANGTAEERKVLFDAAGDEERDVESGLSVSGETSADDSKDVVDAGMGGSMTVRTRPSSTNATRNEEWVKRVCLVLFLLPLLAWIGQTVSVAFPVVPDEGATLGGEVGVKGHGWLREADYDIVVAYYDEDVDILRNTIQTVKRKIQAYHTTKTIVYAKGPTHAGNREAMHRLRRAVGADEVVALKNVGREGETYLNHIARHYNSLTSPLAHQTLFIQPHLAWDWIFLPRLEKVVTDKTGFVSFGPYLNASCTSDGGEVDSHGQSHPRIAQIYSSFQGDLCPGDGFSITWAGQFLASRQRILANKRSTYDNLLEFFHVPKLAEDDPAYATTRKEWIWKEGWWNSIESNPTLGHALERSWPAVFQCSDLKLARDCQGDNERDPEACQCLDG